MLERLTSKPSRLIVGLMSGTSVDGIDAALVSVRGAGPGVQLRFLRHEHLHYADGVRDAILRAGRSGQGRVEDVCRIDGLLGELFARAAQAVVEKAGAGMEQIDLIASHGQTLHHQPVPRKMAGVPVAHSLQVGHPAIIAERTGVTTVADFRARDLAAGGQGAPLVPYADYLLFRHRARGRLALNLGGIANLTAIPAAAELDDVIAFDTGPANMVSDLLMRRLTGGRVHYDRDGGHASRGQVSGALLDRLLDHPYLAQPPPKSCGREVFGEEFIEWMLRFRGTLRPEDLVATGTRFAAAAVAQAHRNFVEPGGRFEELVISGGGVHNRFLVRSLSELLPHLTIRTSDDYGIPAQAKEAVAFALLANETVHGNPGNLPAATGARRPVVLGSIVPGWR